MNISSELLSPAGSMDAFYMALANGADAVYLGGKEFNARASASNFTPQELEEAVDFAHVRRKKVYVTLNILLSDEEIERALKYTEFLWEIGVDALIVQDLGFSQLIRKKLPNFELHASTQMSVVNYEGAKFLEGMGFSRVVVGRETSLEEIEKIRDHTQVEIEAFCHGALCVSVSGQCLMSSMIGGRSGNRGACAQPCRKEYSIVDSRGQLIYDKGFAISPKDLNTIDELEELSKAGVLSFKLEGRMKRPEYVAILTRNYAYALKGKDFNREAVRQIFNRKFTKGLTFGDFSHDYISFDRPDNRGVRVGSLIKKIGKNAVMKATKNLKKGDLLELVDYRGKLKTLPIIEDIEKEEEKVLQLNFRPLVPSPVNRVISEELAQESIASLNNLYQISPLTGQIKIRIGENPSFKLIGEFEVVVFLDQVIEKAKKQGLDKDKIADNLGKFDKSYFYLRDLEFDVDPDAFIPIRLINELRRKALKKYEEKYLIKRKLPKTEELQLEEKEVFLETRQISVEVASLEQLKRIDKNKVDRIELAYRESLETSLNYLEDYKGKIFLSLPFYEEERSYKNILYQYRNHFDGIIVQSLGQLLDLPQDIEVVVGEGLNLFNSYSLELFFKKNFHVISSPESTHAQKMEFVRHYGSCGEVYIYGYQKVMTMKHCPLSLKKDCGFERNCQLCHYRQGYSLKDEKNVEFPFIRKYDFTEVYNSVPTYLGNDMLEVNKLRPTMHKLQFRFDDEPIEEMVDALHSYINGERCSFEEMNKKLRNRGFTRGHLRKGILF